LPDPRMISSLRMHSHFRYSPSFGHQARNVSPMAMGMGTFDGTSPSLLRLAALPSNVSMFLPTQARGRRIRRRVVGDFSSESAAEDAGHAYTHPISAATQQQELSQTVPLEESEPDHHSTNFATQNSSQDNLDRASYSESIHEATRAKPLRSEFRLQSVLRSESHHVFVQPVKELVVKRWKTFRRRLGGSSPSDRLRSDEESESGQSVCSSTGPGNDGRERRRRVQNDSEIDAFMDGDAHSNSPARQQATPLMLESETFPSTDPENSHFQFHLADPLTAVADLVAAPSEDPDQSHWSPLSRAGCAPMSHASTANPELQANLDEAMVTIESVPKKPECQSSISSKQTGSCSAHSYSSRRGQVGRRRKSLLSEVCTPDDFNLNGEGKTEERSVLNGVPLPSSAEIVEPLSPIRQQNQWLDSHASVELKSTVVERPNSEQFGACATPTSVPDQDGSEVTKDAQEEKSGGWAYL